MLPPASSPPYAHLLSLRPYIRPIRATTTCDRGLTAVSRLILLSRLSGGLLFTDQQRRGVSSDSISRATTMSTGEIQMATMTDDTIKSPPQSQRITKTAIVGTCRACNCTHSLTARP